MSLTLSTTTRGHNKKLLKPFCDKNLRQKYFTVRVRLHGTLYRMILLMLTQLMLLKMDSARGRLAILRRVRNY